MEGTRDGICGLRIQDTIPVYTHGAYHSVVAINAASILTPHFVDAPVRPELPPTEHRDRSRAITSLSSCSTIPSYNPCRTRVTSLDYVCLSFNCLFEYLKLLKAKTFIRSYVPLGNQSQ